MNVNIGLTETQRREIADGLTVVLADTHALALKTLNFHWNVRGPLFHTLHLMFEVQYNALLAALDLIAERIRALGYFTPASHSQYAKLTSISEVTDIIPAEAMLEQLLADHETLIRGARALFPKAAAVNDEATTDLLAERMREHEKTAWMLRSTIGGSCCCPDACDKH